MRHRTNLPMLLTAVSITAACGPVPKNDQLDAAPTGGSAGSTMNAHAPDGGAAVDDRDGSAMTATDATGAGNETLEAGVPPATVACPLDKPQKVYGTSVGAVTVLPADETWTPDNVYLVFGHLHSGSHTLTIQAGTTVCFDYSPPAEMSADPIEGHISIETGGALKVLGTASQHVVFAPKNDAKQFWGAIEFGSGAKLSVSTMQNLDLYNAGLSAGGSVIKTFPDATQAPLDMQNVTFVSLQRVGISNLTSGFTPSSKITIYSYASSTPTADLFGYPALTMKPEGIGTLTDANFILGPTVPAPVKYVQLDHAEGARIGNDIHMHKLQKGLAFRNVAHMMYAGTASAPATWTLDAGVIVAVNNGGWIQIGDGSQDTSANIVAVGTVADPVVFTSDAFISGKTAAAGDWSQILFFPGNFDASKSKFDHARFEFGGGADKAGVYNCNDSMSGFAEIAFTNTLNGLDYAGPSITNTAFVSSASQAIRARNNGTGTGTLKTDYTAADLANTFQSVATSPAQFPSKCPQ